METRPDRHVEFGIDPFTAELLLQLVEMGVVADLHWPGLCVDDGAYQTVAAQVTNAVDFPAASVRVLVADKSRLLMFDHDVGV